MDRKVWAFALAADAALADAALADAAPLAQNGYKLPLARGLVARALATVTGGEF